MEVTWYSAQFRPTGTEHGPAESCQEPSASLGPNAPAALWDILSLASIFCTCHRDCGLQSWAEAPSFQDASHPESAADGESGLSSTQPQGTWSMMESHQPFASSLFTKWWLLQVGMEEDLGVFSSVIPVLLFLALHFPEGKGKNLCHHVRT